MIKLSTERLIIRDHTNNDLMSHHALLSDEKTMYFLQDIKTNNLEESKENLIKTIDEIDNPNRTRYFLRIESKAGEHIGEIGYTVTDFTEVGKLVHLGYFIYSKFWGQGYTAEALKAIMDFAFSSNDVFRITTGCIKDNAGSERVMIKCGMTKEGDYRLFEYHDGRMKDRVSYRMLRDEWNTMSHK
jgi:[ribosomal protein S5]-alanine N-acetyltransferase